MKLKEALKNTNTVRLCLSEPYRWFQRGSSRRRGGRWRGSWLINFSFPSPLIPALDKTALYISCKRNSALIFKKSIWFNRLHCVWSLPPKSTVSWSFSVLWGPLSSFSLTVAPVAWYCFFEPCSPQLTLYLRRTIFNPWIKSISSYSG